MKNTEFTKVCDMCENAVRIQDEENILCKSKGIVKKSYRCKRFAYDPLKRIPERAADIPLPSMEEMKI